MNDQSIRSEVILGVDTHLDAHVGAVISEAGKLLGTLSVPADAAGYLKLLIWANSFGCLLRAGVEGTGTYGAGLTRVLRDHEIDVLEVNRPDRSTRRLRGKSDPTDAENAARSVISGSATAIPKTRAPVERKAGRMRRRLRTCSFVGINATAANANDDVAFAGQTLAHVGRRAQDA